VQGVLTGFDGPEDVQYDWGLTTYRPDAAMYPNPVRAGWVTNSGSDTVTKVNIQWYGGGIGFALMPSVEGEYYVGKNPVKVSIDPLTPVMPAGSHPVIICACRGGCVTFLDGVLPSRPIYQLPLPGVRYVATYWEE
jgi:hypothetical protein